MPIDKSRYENAVRYEVYLDDGEDYTEWSDFSAGTITGITSSTNHISGLKSVKFSKTGTSSAFGYVVKSLGSSGMDLSMFAHDGYFCVSIYLPSLTGLDDVYFYLFDSTTGNDGLVFSTNVADLSVGWNHLRYQSTEGDQSGDGVNWSKVNYVIVGLELTTSATTLSNVCIDSIRMQIGETSSSGGSVTATITDPIAVYLRNSSTVTDATVSGSTLYTQELGGGYFEYVIDSCEDYTQWSDLLFSTITNIRNTTKHISGTKSIAFDKTELTSDKGYVYRALGPAGAGIDLSRFANNGYFCFSIYLQDIADVQHVYAGLMNVSNGSDSISFTVEPGDLSVGWNHVRISCTDATQSGSGINWAAVKYVFVGVDLDDPSATLSNIYVDSMRMELGGSVSASTDPISVYLKNGLNADEALISDANTARTTATNVLTVQHIDASGNVLPAGSSVATAIYTQDIGGGAAGGGNFLYTSPEDFTAAYTSSSGITLAGLSYTPVIEQFCSVKAINSAGHATNYTPTTNDFDFDSGTGLLNIGGASFYATDQGYAVSVYGPDKAYDKAYDANNVIITNPEHSWVVGSTLVSGTGVTDGTYYYYYDMNTYDVASLQIKLQSSTTTTSGIITATCEATVQDDSVPYTACRYEDVTYGLFKVYQLAATGGVSNSTIWALNQPTPFRYLRVKVIASSGGSNNCAYSIFARKAYS